MSDDYQKGYDQALRDAVSVIRCIEDRLKRGGNFRIIHPVLPALGVARDAIETLEPGFLPADKPCPASPTAN